MKNYDQANSIPMNLKLIAKIAINHIVIFTALIVAILTATRLTHCTIPLTDLEYKRST